MTTTPQALIPSKFAAVAKAASNNDVSRAEALQHIHVTLVGDKVQVEATNGRLALRATCPVGPVADYPSLPELEATLATEAIVPIKAFTDACKAAKGVEKGRMARSLPILGHVALRMNGQVEMTVTDLKSPQTWNVKPIDGRFPNIDVVVTPTKDATTRIAFNPRLMARLCDAIATLHGDRAPCVVLDVYGPEKPMRLTTTDGNGVEVTALLMPMRI